MKTAVLSLVGDVSRIIIGVVAGLLLALSILISVSNQPSHTDITERLQRIERALIVNNCMIMAPDTIARADCQVDGE